MLVAAAAIWAVVLLEALRPQALASETMDGSRERGGGWGVNARMSG